MQKLESLNARPVRFALLTRYRSLGYSFTVSPLKGRVTDPSTMSRT
jgi:hypothetical protein